MVTRRVFLSGALPPLMRGDAALPPVRAITRGPWFHWFGYYDKLQFDPTGRLVLGMESRFENRSPEPEDAIRIGMVDVGLDDRWIDLGAESRAWCWQQGCMLQWLPGSRSEIIWNDRVGESFVSHIMDVRSRKRRTIPAPVYAVSPDGRWSVAPDFRRLHDTRPGYGYAGLTDPYRDVAAPGKSGIWRTDLDSGKTELVLSFAGALRITGGDPDPHAKHWFNHLLIAPDGKRLVFLHRWSRPKGFGTRMITMNADGSGAFVLDPYGETSHFIWRDSQHILAWARHPSHGMKFYVYRDRTSEVQVAGRDIMVENGHCSYVPGGRWILNDTYPDRDRLQHLYLYEIATGRRIALGHFKSGPEYSGEWRCDLHPRYSRDGRLVCIDSAHGGDGRQMHLIDIGGLG